MRAVIQRVSHARVTIGGEVHGEIGKGFLILLGVCEGDTEAEAVYLADKCTGLRVFTDENDKMNLSPADIGGGLLVISQFTLYGDCKKGKRPNFMRAAKPELAVPLYETFLARCRESGLPVETGEFGADMQVELLNDGPVTILMDTDEMRGEKA
ncbi:MAG: D-tyrosyl-tRNA(Tyr) deacylase [Clostridiaceae bacterium]|nr:D-tyrosyl-tRNA(Tyr) deacylase [Clostridiaceae bacterium]MCI9485327.1 D-tyrosyl-tRNA(Tyr) deacylase [Clostridiaceae bacterium]MDE7035292.1 D-tyrosyl-tRNA(Tyr) deacylase [Eubacteriales bacterium]NBH77224.1 D-tyrosyl-tRNA(Tyr) deacylase [Clostridiaceae bacterium]NBI80697.1 D-tyrosyl-tRNA(Tyr) deacylase [Clostridiaceae bacterium]